ncbi:MAG TPA: hypothetical protein VNL37_06660, partial [Candidatus Polarisedimenticolia bacterium]|nr:hypothetical protein [Candidatus Polarisedimenticolia bacterium]
GNVLIPFDLQGLALSPDGGTLAFVAATDDGRRQIWLRPLSGMEARVVPETVGASYPFWSPDGQSLGFFADGKLETIDLRGGSPRIIADAPSGRGGTWSRDGTILFAPNITSPILRVASSGGETRPVTTYDPKTETTHRWPVFLPDGRHFLYLVRSHAAGRPELGRLMVSSLDAPKASVLIEDASNALYVEPGYLIYGRSANLYAWRFDAASLRLEGRAVPIIPEKMSYWEPKNFVPFAASDDGTILYLPDAGLSTEMRWYDRKGLPLETLAPAGFYLTPRVSHSGRRVAYMHGDTSQSLVDLWVRDLDSRQAVRLTQQSGTYVDPAWTPKDDRIAFGCQPMGVSDLCVVPSGGGTEPRLLYESDTWKSGGSWMPDGRRLIFTSQDPRTNEDLLLLPAEGGAPTIVLRTPFSEQTPEVSPDGSEVAYISNESGRFEVYVRGLGEAARRWQVSIDGGIQPRWRADGRELFYAAADGGLMAVPMQAGADSRPGAPVRLFTLPERPTSNQAIFADVTPDGQRILLNLPTTSRSSVGFHAIYGWTALPSEGGGDVRP